MLIYILSFPKGTNHTIKKNETHSEDIANEHHSLLI